jgi:serine/threonine protein kinase/Tfp pilus assembly protein PilF
MTEMSPAEAIFFAALEKGTPDERAAYLEEACGGDSELRGRVERLLAAHPQVGSFLNQPAVPAADVALEPPQTTQTAPPGANGAGAKTGPSEAVGAVLAGRYKLVQVIGEGGMGTVFMAQQMEPIKRLVAVKLIKLGMDSKQILARFEAERQAVALMDHPNIAKVFDAGATDSGRPFFVMELVKGVPVTQFCDDQQRTVAARLQIFGQVCHAVQHAHQKGIIHRDLKPSNILVESHDGKPVPKVIDFGLAKAVNAVPLTDRSLLSNFGTILGTPQYMAPEQAEFNAIDVDTRADVYALGVILYELLTGTTPLEKQRLGEAAWDEIRRVITEEEPPKPSTRLSSKALPSIAARRQTDPHKLGKFVRGDLDWIVMKALAKERHRRYETANALAADVERFLNHEPVLAGPPTVAYKLRKFVRRNRRAVVAGVTFALLLVMGVALSTWQAVRARRAEREALEERNRATAAEQTASAERDRALIAESKANREAARTAKVNTFLLENVMDLLDNPFQKFSLIRPDPDGRLQTLVDGLAELVESSEFDPQPELEAKFRGAIGTSYFRLGLYTDAQKHLERAYALFSRMKPRAEGVEGAEAEAGAFLTAGLLAYVYKEQGKHDRTLQLWKGVTRPAFFGVELGVTLAHEIELLQRGKYEELERLLLRTLEDLRTAGANQEVILEYVDRLGVVYHTQGKYAQAEEQFTKVIEGRRSLNGADSPQMFTAMTYLAGVWNDQGKHAKAEELFDKTLKEQRRVMGSGHPCVAKTLDGLCLCLVQQKKFSEAESLLRECLEIREQKLPEDWMTFNAKSLLGGSLLGQKKYADAEPLLQAGYEGMKQREFNVLLPQGKARLIEALERLVELYEATDQKQKADEGRKKLEKAGVVAKKAKPY